MKNTLHAFVFALLLSRIVSGAFAQSSAFTYQGRLTDNGSVATGIYDLRFTLYDALTNGSAVGSAITNSLVAVSNGLFVVTLDFGSSVFDGADRWLEIGVRTNASVAPFQILSPRQQITSTPYAIRAANFGGAVSDSQLSANVAKLNTANQTFSGNVNFSNASNSFSGTFSGSGAGLNQIRLGALFTTNRSVIAWPSGFAETSPSPDAYDAISVKAGSSFSLALRADGVVVGWGNVLPAVVPANATNIVAISAGGNHSLALRANGTVLGWGIGSLGQTNAPASATNVIAIAAGNSFSLGLKADGSVIAWGLGSSGQTNVPSAATNVSAIAAGASHALAVRSDGTVIGWGLNNFGQTNPPSSATNAVAVAAGQSHSLALRANGTIVGWGDNSSGQISIPPGATNVTAIAAGGLGSMALRADGTVLVWGGTGSVTNVPSTATNVVAIALGNGFALAARIVNGFPPLALLDHPDVFTSRLTAPSLAGTSTLDLFVGGARALRFEPDGGNSTAANLTAGYPGNSIAPGTGGNTIAGGGFSGGVNSIGDGSRGNFIGAGSGNQIGINVNDSVIGGGFGNLISASRSMIVGGYSNIIGLNANNSFAAGNQAQALHQGSFVWCDSEFGNVFASTAANQFSARASGGVRFVTTGAGLSIDGPITAGDISLSSGVPYHHLEMSGGNSTGYLFGSYPAFGDGIHMSYNYYADNNGSGHVINASGGTSRISVGYGDIVLAVGGVNAAPTTTMLHVTLAGVCVNGTVSNCSDRNVKQNFKSVSPAQILEKVTQLPLSEWSYKVDAATRHIGPMAQDFYSAFNVGMDEKHIASIDEGGVALAAIQGLNQKVDEKEQRIRELEKTVRELKELIRELATKKETPL